MATTARVTGAAVGAGATMTHRVTATATIRWTVTASSSGSVVAKAASLVTSTAGATGYRGTKVG